MGRGRGRRKISAKQFQTKTFRLKSEWEEWLLKLSRLFNNYFYSYIGWQGSMTALGSKRRRRSFSVSAALPTVTSKLYWISDRNTQIKRSKKGVENVLDCWRKLNEGFYIAIANEGSNTLSKSWLNVWCLFFFFSSSYRLSLCTPAIVKLNLSNSLHRSRVFIKA